MLLDYDPDISFGPSGDYRTCWKDFDYRLREMEDEAAELFPENEAVGGRPLIFRPLHNRLIDFFIWRNLPEDAYAVSVQVPLKLTRQRFEKPSAYLENRDGSPKKFDSGQVLSFAQAFPSDHCPLLMQLTTD